MENQTRCGDCKHYLFSKTDGHPEFARCGAPQNLKQDLVTGEFLDAEITYCSTHRSCSTDITCGAIGRWFEPKQPKNVCMAPIPNRPQRTEIETQIMSGSLDGYDLSDLVDAITAKAKELAPDFEFDTTSFQDALAAIEDNPKTNEAEPYDEQDEEDRRLHV